VTALAAAAAALLFALPAAADWPQWRGPDRDGESPESGLLREWPDGGPPLAWSASGLGGGFSSVSIADGRIYTLGDLADGQYVLALDQDGGERIWKTRVGPTWEDRYLGSRSTPTTDGDRVYALGTEGDLVCLSAATGEKLWHRNLREDFGGFLMQAQGNYDWKYAESPLVDGDRVIVTPGAPDAALVALDKTTGEEIWRTKLPELEGPGIPGAGYSSAVVSEAAGVRQVVQLLGPGVVGVDAETGRLLWSYTRVANAIANIATPLVDGDRIFVSTGYGTGAALLEIGRGEEGVSAREVYFLDGDTMQNHHGEMILHQGHVYTGTGHNQGYPLAVELESGEVAWGPVRNDGRNSAAVIYADGRLYFRYQNGVMVLVEATPDGYREKGSFEIPGVEHPSWSLPAIADGKLYLREQDALHVYDLRPPAKPEPKPESEAKSRR
jgi:outer membrane protein assembly factor BamB